MTLNTPRSDSSKPLTLPAPTSFCLSNRDRLASADAADLSKGTEIRIGEPAGPPSPCVGGTLEVKLGGGRGSETFAGGTCEHHSLPLEEKENSAWAVGGCWTRSSSHSRGTAEQLSSSRVPGALLMTETRCFFPRLVLLG